MDTAVQSGPIGSSGSSHLPAPILVPYPSPFATYWKGLKIQGKTVEAFIIKELNEADTSLLSSRPIHSDHNTKRDQRPTWNGVKRS